MITLSFLLLISYFFDGATCLTPTSAPSNQCFSGSYYDEDSFSCVSCPIGHFSSFSVPPYPLNCSLCEVGMYNTKTGMSECSTCPRGKISSSTRSHCDDCNAGTYVLNQTLCVECQTGKYAPQALSDSCLDCEAGAHTNNLTMATRCSTCDGGKYSISSSTECSFCSLGKYSQSGASECLNCLVGFFTDQVGSSSCTACSAGNYLNLTGASNCSVCATGKYQGSTGQAQCNDCEAGKYTSTTGSSSCSSCSSGKTSSSGSSSCDLAAEGYFLSYPDGHSTQCPSHADCFGGRMTPIPHKGYWVDHSDFKYNSHLYHCSRKTCKGSEQGVSCWASRNQYNSTMCNQCKTGAQGVLCGSCSPGYMFRNAFRQCDKCDVAQHKSLIALVCLTTIAMLFLLVLRQEKSFFRSFWVCKVLNQIDGGRYKALWVTYQIIASVSYTSDIKFPAPFCSMLDLMSFFSLDVLCFDCIWSHDNSSSRYFRTLLLWCTTPLMLTVLVVMGGILRLVLLQHQTTANPEKSQPESRMNIISEHMWLSLLFVYMVLPPVVYRQLQFFDCLTLSSGARYVRTDTSVDCSGSAYMEFKPIVITFAMMYLLIPFVWLFFLSLHRAALDPPTSNDEHLALFIRDSNPDLAPLRFLFADYKCSKWWFDIVDMYRRLFFIAVLPLVSAKSSTRASFGCFLAIVSAVYFREAQPYRTDFSNFLAHIAQYSLLVTYFSILVIETHSMNPIGLKGFRLGLFLVSINFAILLSTLVFAYFTFLSKKKKQDLLNFKAKNYEDARNYTANKFNTTFEAIRLHSIPSSDALVFHYTSFEFADSYRKAGIPAQDKYGGIPVTLRPPHASTDIEFQVFNETAPKTLAKNIFPNEEVFVLSLPRIFLEPLPGFESDNGVFMISAVTLNALRPSTFASVIDESPWLASFTLLPPHRILRSFLVMDINRTRRRISFIKPMKPHRPSKGRLRRNSSISAKMEEVDHGFERMEFMKDVPMKHTVEIVNLDDISTWGKAMERIREEARLSDLIPLYHYTSSFVVPMVLRGGLRMSSQGQGDGGVYLSTLGPASYGIGTEDYEVDVIKDCFGVERVEEYLGKGNLDVVIIYGCSASVLHQAPGGRDNARMVAKSTFEAFSMAQNERSYFLRPDRVLGGFYVNPKKPPILTAESNVYIQTEKQNDLLEIAKLERAEFKLRKNATRVEASIASVRTAIWTSPSSTMDTDSTPQRSTKKTFWMSGPTVVDLTRSRVGSSSRVNSTPPRDRKHFWRVSSRVDNKSPVSNSTQRPFWRTNSSMDKKLNSDAVSMNGGLSWSEAPRMNRELEGGVSDSWRQISLVKTPSLDQVATETELGEEQDQRVTQSISPKETMEKVDASSSMSSSRLPLGNGSNSASTMTDEDNDTSKQDTPKDEDTSKQDTPKDLADVESVLTTRQTTKTESGDSSGSGPLANIGELVTVHRVDTVNSDVSVEEDTEELLSQSPPAPLQSLSEPENIVSPQKKRMSGKIRNTSPKITSVSDGRKEKDVTTKNSSTPMAAPPKITRKTSMRSLSSSRKDLDVETKPMLKSRQISSRSEQSGKVNQPRLSKPNQEKGSRKSSAPRPNRFETTSLEDIV